MHSIQSAADHINLISNNEGEKTVSIYNSTGTLLSSCNLSGIENSINTSLLSQGLYFMKILELNSKKVYILKFIRE